MSADETKRAAKASIPMPSLLTLAAWFGLLAGLLELAVLTAQDAYRLRVTVASIRTNHHYVWMIPISGLMIVLTSGVVLGQLARVGRKPVLKIAMSVLCFIAVLMPLLAVRGLYTIASVVLAAGLASRIVPMMNAHPARFRGLVRVSLPLMAVFVALLVGIRGSRVAFAERRARNGLPAATPGSPNVLLIVMDNVRADHLSLYGYPRETTPNLKRLAERGVRFDLARAPAPWTLPSHASMLTGRWPHQLSTSVDTPLDDTYPTLAEHLSGQGYVTAGFVANTYYCNAWYGLDRGFSRYEDFDENLAITPFEIFSSSQLGSRLAHWAGVQLATPGQKESRKTAVMLNRDVLHWLETRGDRPFFAFLNYYDAHEPFDTPAGHPRKFGLSALEEPARRAISKRFRTLSRKAPPAPGDPPRNDAEVVRDASALIVDSYDDCIAYLDEQLGTLFDDLERLGLLENTLVVITSDHGEHFGERGLFGHGVSLYRSLIDVPLVVIPPTGKAAASSVTTPVSPRDLPATVLDLLGQADRNAFPGQSLARHWRSESGLDPKPDEPPFSHVEHQPRMTPAAHIPASLGPLWSIVAEDSVYIRNGDGREELYNLSGDRAEARNLSQTDATRPILERLRAKLDRVLEDGPVRR